jgi:hypothetical protein
MSKSIKLMAMFGLVATIAACSSGQTEDDFVVVEPISVEPVYTGKFK